MHNREGELWIELERSSEILVRRVQIARISARDASRGDGPDVARHSGDCLFEVCQRPAEIAGTAVAGPSRVVDKAERTSRQLARLDRGGAVADVTFVARARHHRPVR